MNECNSSSLLGPRLARFRYLVGHRSWEFGESKIYILQNIGQRSGPQRWHQMSSICVTTIAAYFKCWISTSALRQKRTIWQDQTTDPNSAFPSQASLHSSILFLVYTIWMIQVETLTVRHRMPHTRYCCARVIVADQRQPFSHIHFKEVHGEQE